MKIDAYVVEGINRPFTREELTLDEPGPGEVLVRVVATGVCHTDLNTQGGDMPLPLPGVLGHEGSGVVEQVGEVRVVAGDNVVDGVDGDGLVDGGGVGEDGVPLAVGAVAHGGDFPCQRV